MQNYLNIARKAAGNSQETFQIGSCFVKSGRVLSTGFNSLNKSNALVRKYFHYPTLHAEIAALSKLDPDMIRDGTLYVYRLRKTGKAGLSKPCHRCQIALRELGIKRIVYSTDEAPYYDTMSPWEVAA